MDDNQAKKDLAELLFNIQFINTQFRESAQKYMNAIAFPFFITYRSKWHSFKAEVLGRTKELAQFKMDLENDLDRINGLSPPDDEIFKMLHAKMLNALKDKLAEVDIRLANNGKTIEASKKLSGSSLRFQEEAALIVKSIFDSMAKFLNDK